ncbi:AbgT family transporter [Alkalicoccobacillus plakortidis]|uniref:AbgT family transporter n=1 Tax=Alkalicoccobacillus plakortidis TaxID=444060 RepID=A0ABT0XIX1_9BACI|nr:AbgT family transporter [Alkalicoccobacillus plakortidis]MCM2675857.1 AbgT family transporter [Alkalicoccobacillus plakortidis]
MVENFTGFAPLGLVLTIMLGIGLAERVGLLSAFIKKLMMAAPVWLVPYAIFFMGNFATVAADSAYLIVPPLAGIIYYSLGRHPIAGVVTGFVGVSSGYATGILITSNEPLLAGISNEAMAVLSLEGTVTPVSNYFFMIAGALLCTIIGGTITRKLTEPRLGAYTGDVVESTEPVSKEETSALKLTGLVAFIYIAILVVGMIVPNSFLLNEDGGLVPSPFIDGIVVYLLILFALIGLTYGIKMKRISGMKDVANYMGEAIGSMRNFIVLVFFIGQFTAFFQWSGIGLWVSVNGTNFLEAVNFTGFGLIITFILMTSLMNLVITSGSGQWAIFAPIFIPMFIQLGYDPAFTQMAYRVGDSSTSMLTPLSAYTMITLEFIRKYQKDAGFGSLISLTLPYAVCVLVGMTLLLAIFYVFGIPVGPGSGVRL